LTVVYIYKIKLIEGKFKSLSLLTLISQIIHEIFIYRKMNGIKGVKVWYSSCRHWGESDLQGVLSRFL